MDCKTKIILILMLVNSFAVTNLDIGALEATDPNAVQKWEVWDSNLNVSGGFTADGLAQFNTSRVYVGDVRTISWLDPTLLAAEPGFFGVCEETTGRTCSAFLSTDADLGTSLGAVSFGVASMATNSPFAVARMSSNYGSYDNTGSLAIFYHWDGQHFPAEAVQILTNSIDNTNNYVLKANGVLLPDGTRGVMYVQNAATRPAYEAADSTKVCPNLNADLLDGYHAVSFWQLGNTITSNLIPDVNITYDIGNSTNYWDDAYINNLYVSDTATFENDIIAPNILTNVINDTVWIEGDLHVGGQSKFNNSQLIQSVLFDGENPEYIYFELPNTVEVTSAYVNLTGSFGYSEEEISTSLTNSLFLMEGCGFGNDTYVGQCSFASCKIYDRATNTLQTTISRSSVIGGCANFTNDMLAITGLIGASSGGDWFYNVPAWTLNNTTTYGQAGSGSITVAISDYYIIFGGRGASGAVGAQNIGSIVVYNKTDYSYLWNTTFGITNGIHEMAFDPSNSSILYVSAPWSSKSYAKVDLDAQSYTTHGTPTFQGSITVTDDYIITAPSQVTQGPIRVFNKTDDSLIGSVTGFSGYAMGLDGWGSYTVAVTDDGSALIIDHVNLEVLEEFEDVGSAFVGLMELEQDIYVTGDRTDGKISELTFVPLPQNVTIDTGNNGQNDYTNTTDFMGPERIDLNITAINDYLSSCTPIDGICSVPLKLNSTQTGTLTLSTLHIAYDADIYARYGYFEQLFAVNTSLVSYDDELDLRKDSGIAKSIEIVTQDGIDYFKLPDEFYQEIKGKKVAQIDRIISWLIGSIKEYANRLDWIENGLQLHDQQFLDLQLENQELEARIVELEKICGVKE